MRKALIGMILAATAATPVAAWAQDEDNSRVERIRQRIEQRQQARSEQPPEARVQRQEQRSEPRVERRQERREARQEPQVQVQTAQPSDTRGRRDREGRSGDTQRYTVYPDAWQGDPNSRHRQRYERLERRNQYRNGTREQREAVREEWQERPELRRERRQETRREWQNRGEWRDGRDGRRGDWRDGRRDWSRDWNRTSWRNDRRYDWHSWRYRNRSLFRLSPYYSPYRNYGYSRFSIGLFLEPLFYSQRYWLNDPFQYRLPYAPPGTQWIRYYNDVLLVDVYSGEVIDVIYDFFW